MFKCEDLNGFASIPASCPQATELQGLLLQNSADPSRPCIGGNLNGDVTFDSMVCGGLLQVFSNARSFHLSIYINDL